MNQTNSTKDLNIWELSLMKVKEGLAANRKAKAIGQNQIGSANQKPVFQILH